MSRSLKAHLLLVFVTFVWGATFLVIKNVLTDISPLLFNSIRMTFAAFCLAVFYWRHIRRIDGAVFMAGLLTGAFLWAGYEFQTTGLKLTTPSKSGFLTGVSVVLVPVFLALFWKRKVNRWTALGVAAAFAGLVLMTVPAGTSATGSSSLWGDWGSVNFGDVLTLGCAVAFGFHIIFIGRATQKYGFERIAFLQTAVAATLMFATVPLVERVYLTWTPQLLWAIGITGVFGTAVAFSIQAWAQQFTPPTHTALIFALEPVFAWLTSYLVQGERLGMRAGLGAMFILAGILTSELKGHVATAKDEAVVAEMA
ncbi:MAG: putative 10 drug/metabolite exporter, family, superfamily [Candidatus Angelobacter sp.]|nr:putative 10 drug/metabolite exporter, family, superfamily [Candidatus Angelobacter sp.]